MKKSDLKNLITEIVRRKLNESQGRQFAEAINRIFEEETYLDDVQVVTNYGSHPLQIKEVWADGHKLYIGVEANPPASINELDLSTVDTSAGETGLTDADKKELAVLKAQSDKLTSNIKKIEGDVAKMQATIQPKMQRAERQKAKLQKQQADVIRKQQGIQDKA